MLLFELCFIFENKNKRYSVEAEHNYLMPFFTWQQTGENSLETFAQLATAD